MNIDAIKLHPKGFATTKRWLQEEYKNSLYLTTKCLLGMRDVNKETHGKVLSILESDSKRKLLVLPRGHLKSSIGVVAFSIWSLIRNPNLRILIDSELYTNSCTFLREIKAHLESKSFQNVFGSMRTKTWNESEIIIASRNETLKEASIVCGGIGTTKTGQHFDLIIGDDMNSHANSNSKENCEKVVQHYRNNLSILEPDGTYVLIGTRYSANDLIGHILEFEETDFKEVA